MASYALDWFFHERRYISLEITARCPSSQHEALHEKCLNEPLASYNYVSSYPFFYWIAGCLLFILKSFFFFVLSVDGSSILPSFTPLLFSHSVFLPNSWGFYNPLVFLFAYSKLQSYHCLLSLIYLFCL